MIRNAFKMISPSILNLIYFEKAAKFEDTFVLQSLDNVKTKIKFFPNFWAFSENLNEFEWLCHILSYPTYYPLGVFHVVAKIIRELKIYMMPYKVKCSHWWKIVKKKSCTRFALQSECCNFKQWEHLNL